MQHERLAGPREEWPSRKDKELLFKAAKAGKDKVTFSDGQVFTLKHEKRKKSLAWGEYHAVYVSPAGPRFSPCGWFHVKFLLTKDS